MAGAKPEDVAELRLIELYKIRDTFFPGNAEVKKAQLQAKATDVLDLLDSVPAESRIEPSRCARWEYLRGKALEATADYSREAEEHLAKAVQLDPALVDAWCSLGNSFWKKNELDAARNCLVQALSSGPNVRALQQLSMLERRMAKGGPQEAQSVDESINHAKQAVALDVHDGQSWYTLGNAYLTSFFVSGAWDMKKLDLSLKAYQNAEKDELASANPDLHFNSAIVHQYLEDYERALGGYECAGSRDPSLHADQEVEKLLRLLAKLTELSANKGRIKPKRMAAMLAGGVVSGSLPHSFQQVSVDSLKEGVNKGIAVAGKVCMCIFHDQVVPLFYLLAESEENCIVVSVYSLRDGAIKEGSTLTLLEPQCRVVNVTWRQHKFRYKTVRIDHPKQILVNGRPLLMQDAVRYKIQAQHVPP